MKLSELLLLYISENSLIYDIVDIIGLDNTLKLVSVFGGEIIQIPSRETIKSDIIDVIIYSTLYHAPDNITLIDTLCNRFKLTQRDVKKRFKRASNNLNTGNIAKIINTSPSELVVADIEQYILELAD